MLKNIRAHISNTKDSSSRHIELIYTIKLQAQLQNDKL